MEGNDSTRQRRGGGTRISNVELEQRLRVVETLIVLGRGKTAPQLQHGLEEAGHGFIAESTVRAYAATVRERLNEADQDIRRMREEAAAKRILQTDMEITRLLTAHKVVPSWRDKVSVLQIMERVFVRGHAGAPGSGEALLPDQRGGTPEPDETDTHTEKELDDLLREMLQRSGAALLEQKASEPRPAQQAAVEAAGAAHGAKT